MTPLEKTLKLSCWQKALRLRESGLLVVKSLS
jgi:hypothetical protein